MEDTNQSSYQPLFHSPILEASIKQQKIPADHKHIVSEWVNNLSSLEKRGSDNQKDAFVQKILCNLLGYQTKDVKKKGYTIEEKNGLAGHFDMALGTFSEKNFDIVALVKLLDPSTKDLGTVALFDQAKKDAKGLPNCRYLLISNLDEIRFYSLNRKPNVFEKFSLKDMAHDETAYQSFCLVLNAENLLSGKTAEWLYESRRTRLYEKLTKNHPTLKEAYGPLNKGITTGLNDAFIIDKKTYDALIQQDPKSAEILRRFIESNDLERWAPRFERLWLIYTPKGQVDIDLYPAIKSHLLPFKEQLEKRLTEQKWFELDDAEVDRLALASQLKVGFARKSNEPNFLLDASSALYPDSSYFTSYADYYLVGLLNSTTLWKLITIISEITEDGFYDLHHHHIEKLPVPDADALARAKIGRHVHFSQEIAADRRNLIQHFWGMTAHNLSKQGLNAPLSDKLEKWFSLDFPTFRNEIISTFGQDIPEDNLELWNAYLEQEKQKIYGINADLAHSEWEINSTVYELFELNEDEIAFIEGL